MGLCWETYEWIVSPWGECSETCGKDVHQSRTVTCSNSGGFVVADENCLEPMPDTSTKCENVSPCVNFHYHFSFAFFCFFKIWSEGGGG